MSTNQRKYAELQYRRIQGGRLLEQGCNNHEITEIPGCSLSVVRHWRKIVDEQGVQALVPKPRPGRTARLNVKQLEKLKRLLKKGATKFGHANAIRTSRRVIFQGPNLCRILRKLNYPPKKPVKRSKKYSHEAINRWIKYRWPHIKKVA
jgi:transposase